MNPRARLINYINNSFSPELLPPRGEIWIEPQVLKSEGLPNNAAGVTNFAAQIGADYCFFSCNGAQPVGSAKSDLSEAVKKAHSLDLACGAVIDGPWQKLAYQDGLMPLLQKIISEPFKLEKSINNQSKLAWNEIAAWVEAGVDLLLVADDIAYSRGLYFSTSHFEQFLQPSYINLFSMFKPGILPSVGFHSDGDLSSLIPGLIDTGFSYFSLEPETIDLKQILSSYNNQIFIMSGIRADWLYGENAADNPTTNFPDTLPVLLKQGKLVLSSTCGLYQPSSVTALKSIYQWIDDYYKMLEQKPGRIDEDVI